MVIANYMWILTRNHEYCQGDYDYATGLYAKDACPVACKQCGTVGSTAVCATACPTLVASSGVTIVHSHAHAVGSVATHSCDNLALVPDGDASRTCQSDGSWSGVAPTHCGCNANHAWDGSTCGACPAGFMNDAGTASASGPAVTCAKCVADYAWDGFTCTACSGNTSNAAGTMASGPTTVCPTCADDFHWDGSACAGCGVDTSSTGLAASGPNNTCAGDCGTNERWNGTVYAACPMGKLNEPGTTAMGASAVCRLCDANYTWDGSTCAVCPAGFVTRIGTVASGAAATCVARCRQRTTPVTGYSTLPTCEVRTSGSIVCSQLPLCNASTHVGSRLRTCRVIRMALS